MRMRLLVAIAVLASVAPACGADPGASSTTLLPAPDLVVREWLAAIDEVDAVALDGLVASASLAFVIGIESRLAPDEIAELAEAGPSSDVVAAFWTSFDRAFTDIDGADFTSLAVGSSRVFDAGGARFAAVTLGSGDRSTEVLVRRSVEGRWEIDVLATVGSGLVVPLTDLAARATADRFRTLFDQWVLPGLEAAARVDGDPLVADAVRDLRVVFEQARS